MMLVVTVVAVPCIALVALATRGFKHYGEGLFVLIPFAAGLVSSWLYNRNREWNWLKTFWMVVLTMMVVGWGMIGFRIEGLFCVLLASVLAAVLSLLGMFVAWLIRRLKKHQQTIVLIVFTLVPLTMGFEYRHKLTPPVDEQTTSIEINAPPETVWQFVPAFPVIKADPLGMLAHGIAYPICSEIDGQGVGARRRCVLSTGTMPEVITAWEPAKLLEFDVQLTPSTMSEINPFGPVEAAHTFNYFKVHHGRFILTLLPNGRTRVDGTSWFQQDLWPQAYWLPITRRVVKAVHERVLEHIKQLAENSAAE